MLQNYSVNPLVWLSLAPELRADLESEGFGPSSWDFVQDDPACTGCISSQAPEDLPWLTGEILTIYRGYVSIRPETSSKDDCPSPKRFLIPERMEDAPSGIGALTKPDVLPKRGTITGFSRSSRRRMIQRVASLESLPDLWLDLTFPDEAFPECSDYRSLASYTYDRLRTWGQWLRRTYPGSWLIWRREWVSRKSGAVAGELRPHFHVLLRGLPSEAVPAVMRSWVGHLALDPLTHAKALSVALSPESWRRIESHKMAACYASKYLAKLDSHEIPEADSLGRMWGVMGEVPVGSPVQLRVSKAVAVQLRRAFRRKARRSLRKCKAFGRRLASLGSSLFVLVERETVERLVEWAGLAPGCLRLAPDDVPF